MKKLLIALLALTVVGATAFAADPAIKVSGYVNSGVKFVNAEDAAGDKVTTNDAFTDDDGDVAATVGKITVEYSSETSGAVLTYRFSTDLDNDEGSVGISTAYGWASPLAGLKLVAGKGYMGSFDGVDDDSNDYFDTEAVSAIYSMSGFTVGAGFNNTPRDASQTMHPIYGAAYALDGVFSARFSAATNAGAFEDYSFSAKYIGVPNLTVSAGYLAENQDTDTVADPASAWMDGTVKYVFGDAYAQVVVYNYIDREFFSVAPRVGYKVNDKLSVYAQLAYLTEGKSAAGSGPAATGDYETMKPRLNATYAFDANAKANTRFEYNTEKESSTFWFEFVYSF
jgi:hypothetical protein